MKPELGYEKLPYETIVVLCDDYKEAQWAYEIHLEYLTVCGKGEYVIANDYCCELITDDDLCFIFIDRHYLRHLNTNPDTTTVVDIYDALIDMPFD